MPVGNIDTPIILEPVDLNPFLGTGTIAVTNTFTNLTSILTSNQGGFGNLNGTSSGRMGGILQIQYFWEDPIPEPATWGMMILGFGMVGSALRRRRHLAAL